MLVMPFSMVNGRNCLNPMTPSLRGRKVAKEKKAKDGK